MSPICFRIVFGKFGRLTLWPVAKRVPQIVKSELLTILHVHSGSLCSQTQIVGDENKRRGTLAQALKEGNTKSSSFAWGL